MDQYSDNKVLSEVLAKQAGSISTYANDLQRLAHEHPQSGLLHALVVRAGLQNGSNAAAYFDSRVLHKLVNRFDSLPPVTEEQIIKPLYETPTKAAFTIPDEPVFFQPVEFTPAPHQAFVDAPQAEIPVEELAILPGQVTETEQPQHHAGLSHEEITVPIEPVADEYLSWPPQEHHREDIEEQAPILTNQPAAEISHSHESAAEPIAVFHEPEAYIETPVQEHIPAHKRFHEPEAPIETPVSEHTPATEEIAEVAVPEHLPTYETVQEPVPADEHPYIPPVHQTEIAETAASDVPQQESHAPAWAFHPVEETTAPEQQIQLPEQTAELTHPEIKEEEPANWAGWEATQAEENSQAHTPYTENAVAPEAPASTLTPVENTIEPFEAREPEFPHRDEQYEAPSPLEYEWVVTPNEQAFEMDERLLDHLAAEYFTFDKSLYGQAPLADAPFIAEPATFQSDKTTDTAATSIFQADEELEPEIKTKPPIKLDISRYHDEKMPYSFMWWLDKTRRENSGLYQPFVKAPATVSNTAAKPEKDELQQQYYENIFHLTSIEELNKKTGPQNVQFNLNRKEDVIIRRFIKDEPHITAPVNEKLDTENKAKRSSEDSLEIVTETLARIYTDQMLYPKAIATYKKLMLKYPEKSRYFASQIKNLENKTN